MSDGLAEGQRKSLKRAPDIGARLISPKGVFPMSHFPCCVRVVLDKAMYARLV